MAADLIDQFVLYTENFRSCDLYRKWCGIALVAGAMERRIRTTVSVYETWPNLYVMLVGPPASGKSIIDTVKRIWHNTKNELGLPAFYTSTDDSTRAALVDELNSASQVHIPSQYKYKCLLVAVEEFSNFFARYEPELLSFFTKVYNAPDFYEEGRRKSGKLFINAPIMTALLGYQPQLLQDILIKDAADQGFLRRSILIWNETADRRPLFGPPLNGKISDQILERLTEISSLSGTMMWDQDAQDLLGAWDASGGQPRPLHPMLQFYLETRTQHIVKLAMSASMSEDTNMVIKRHHVERAISWLLEAERRMPDIFDYMKGNSDLNVMQGLTAALLREVNAGHTMVTEEFLYTWLSKKTRPQNVKQIIISLEAMKIIVKQSDGSWRITGATIN